MKRILFILLVLSLTVFACATPAVDDPEDNAAGAEGQGQAGANSTQDSEDSTVETPTQDAAPDEQPAPASTHEPTCYPDGDHPIAISIVDLYHDITTYEEVMTWFCDGALFEDILNALSTEELSGMEAETTLIMLAEGKTWNQIWLELGVINE